MNSFSLKSASLEIFILLILFADLFLRELPILPITIMVVLLQFKRLDINSNIFLMLTCMPEFLGGILNSVGVPHVGGALSLVGIGVLIWSYSRRYTSLYCIKDGLLFILLTLGLFFFSSMMTTGGDFALTKLWKTVNTIFYSFLGFIILFSNKDKINPLIALYMTLYGFFLLRCSIFTNGIPGPSSILDFGFLKVQNTVIFDELIDRFYIQYQSIGYYSLQGFALLYILAIKEKKYIMFILGMSVLLSLYSGARQTIVIAFVLLLLSSIKRSKNILSISIFFAFFYLLFTIVSASEGMNSLFGSTFEKGYVEGGGRGPWMLRGIELFLQTPYFGVGYGRYNIFNTYGTYPHNMIIEILCELGIVGALCMILFTYGSIRHTKDRFKYAFFYILVLFLRSMASGGLEDNIVVFVAMYSLPALNESNIKYSRLINKQI